MKRSSLIPDPALALFALIATVIGLFFVFDAGYARSIGSKDSSLIPPEFKSQLMFLIPSIAVGFFCGRLKEESWLKASKVLFVVALLMLIAVMKFGIRQNGAQRWLGFGSFAIQPAEFAKLACVMYLAAIFTTRKPWPERMKPSRNIPHWMDTVMVPKIGRAIPAVMILVVIGLIDHEKDLGTAGVIAATAFVMFIVAGVTRKSLILAIALSLIGGWILVQQQPYRLERIVNHENRWAPDNVDDTSFQTVQSELAMASGGVVGVGIGNGRAKQVIPATTTDFVMATVAEEFGLLGALVVLLTLGGVVWRLMSQAALAKSKYASLVLYGIGTWIGVQTCTNVMMANGFLPAIGIPLPFVSSGGSSLMALWCAVGIAQSAIASSTEKMPAKPKSKPRRPLPKAAVYPHRRMADRPSRA
jgi:cell division protein FtsW